MVGLVVCKPTSHASTTLTKLSAKQKKKKGIKRKQSRVPTRVIRCISSFRVTSLRHQIVKNTFAAQ